MSVLLLPLLPEENNLSYDVVPGSEIMPLVDYRFMGNIMTSITTLRTK